MIILLRAVLPIPSCQSNLRLYKQRFIFPQKEKLYNHTAPSALPLTATRGVNYDTIRLSKSSQHQ
jgi:hypothetical protein